MLKVRRIETNLTSYSDWEDGQTGNSTYFRDYGAGNAIRINASGPHGMTIPVWQTTGTSISGGWNQTNTDINRISIDPTKSYRCSLWVIRKIKSTANAFFFGAFAYDSGGTTQGLRLIETGAIVTNPYFTQANYTSLETILPENEWRLVIAYIRPHTWTGTTTTPDAGWYKPDGTKISFSSNIEYKFRDENSAKMVTRLLFPYQQSENTVTQNCYPRIDLVDGTEPSIYTLLNNEGSWREVEDIKINIGDNWKPASKGFINIEDTWKEFYSSILTFDYLIAAGGGGGGTANYNDNREGGGGGAGGLVTGSTTLPWPGNVTSITVVVGAGGAGGLVTTGNQNSNGVNGGNSSLGSIVAIGGGGGQGIANSSPYTYITLSGGSTGGTLWPPSDAAAAASGQGNRGGKAGSIPTSGGGGGFSASGQTSSGNKGGDGGIGYTTSMSGTTINICGGGGGATSSTTASNRGYGQYGGGDSAYSGGGSTAGKANTGGGGGAGNYVGGTKLGGSSGGSGVVIIRYTSDIQLATGGNYIYQVGGDWVHCFTTVGSATFAKK